MNVFEVTTLGTIHVTYSNVDFIHLDKEHNTEFELLIVNCYYIKSQWKL